MSIERDTKEESYFKYRNVSDKAHSNYVIGDHLENILPQNKDAMILDIGCGFGRLLSALNQRGYTNVCGVDISNEAVMYGRKYNLNIDKIETIVDFAKSCESKYDFIIMTHVLEHLEKTVVMETLQVIRTCLLKKQGQLFLTVPNAQSNTGCYWAYEDFTHQTMYTAGSIYYVLKAAGFENIKLIDPDCTEGLPLPKKIIRKAFLMIYKKRKQFWNKITSSSYHKPSPQIFSFEIKALAQSL